LEDNTIIDYRIRKGLTQKQLANMLDIPRTTMSFYENKRMYPTLAMAEKLGKILDKTIGQLYSEDELKMIK